MQYPSPSRYLCFLFPTPTVIRQMRQNRITVLPSESFVMDAERIEAQRCQQSWRYACVAWVIFAFMAGFLWLRDYPLGASISTVQTCVLLTLMLLFRKQEGPSERRKFTNLFLGFSCFAVFSVSVAHPSVSVALFFLPLGIVMASQVLGVKGGLPWLGVNLVAFAAFPLLTHSYGTPWTATELETLVLSLGVTIGTFLCCHQSESLFGKRTAAMVELSSGFHRLATTDSLTGLMNRLKFQDQLEASLEEAKRESSRFALLLIDMDGFKKINDSLGHLVGDDTLREIARRLSNVAGADSSYRLGGDEFCVIMSGLDDSRQANELANELAEAICQSLCERYFLADTEFQLGTSLGIALYPDHATSSVDLLAFADTAMYHAKENRLGVCGYDDELTQKLVSVAKMQNRLAAGLKQDEFFLVYQPQTELETGRVVGVEALLRWNCDGKIVSPGEFIPLLEKSRLIIPVGRWLVREACRQLREWTDAGYDVGISVNVSVVQFHDTEFTSSVSDAIDDFGIDPGRLDFEVTEGVLIENFPEVVQRLSQLKKKGATISIDDFGTGYSSLAYLRQLPLDKLKIDRAFVKDIPDGDDGTIASSIIALASALDLKIVAEGVETQEQLDFLRRHDCDLYQGFFHSRPVKASEVTRYLVSNDILTPSTT